MYHLSPQSLRPARIHVTLVGVALALPIAAYAQPPGDDLEIGIEAPPAPPPTTAATETSPTLTALSAELATLRARLEQLEAQQSEAARAAGPEVAAASETTVIEAATTSPAPAAAAVIDGLRFGAYLQVQLQHADLSRDQLQQNGAALNQDGFVLRRGRLQILGAWDVEWAAVGVELELDANTVRGPAVGVYRGNVWGAWGPGGGAAPWLEARVGLTEIPFGLEIRDSQRDRLFMERSLGSSALFPGTTDLGARLRGTVGPFRYDVGASNGSPAKDGRSELDLDPTQVPDVSGRVGAEAAPLELLRLAGGVSFLFGTGLHRGTPAEKPHLQWRDFNQNGQLNTGETIAVSGRAAQPSVTFERWAVGVDLSAAVQTDLGWSRLTGEVVLAQNLDRGLFVSDPVFAGSDQRQLAWYVAFIQDVSEWAFAGARIDAYDPDIDLLDTRVGVRVPADASIYTFSPVAGARLPGRGRLSVQYDVVVDHFGRDAAGVPADVRNDRFVVRLQGEL